MEWRLVTKWGHKCAEARYKNEEWNNWFFPVDEKPHEGWVYMPEFGLYRRNTSI